MRSCKVTASLLPPEMFARQSRLRKEAALSFGEGFVNPVVSRIVSFGSNKRLETGHYRIQSIIIVS